jgi:hypothetical protein
VVLGTLIVGCSLLIGSVLGAAVRASTGPGTHQYGPAVPPVNELPGEPLPEVSGGDDGTAPGASASPTQSAKARKKAEPATSTQPPAAGTESGGTATRTPGSGAHTPGGARTPGGTSGGSGGGSSGGSGGTSQPPAAPPTHADPPPAPPEPTQGGAIGGLLGAGLLGAPQQAPAPTA